MGVPIALSSGGAAEADTVLRTLAHLSSIRTDIRFARTHWRLHTA